MTKFSREPGFRPANPARALPVLLALAAGSVVPAYLALVRAWGRNIPQPAIEADYVVAVVWAAVLALIILVLPVPRSDRPALLVLWGAKCFVTLGFMLFYEFSYGLDSYLYFEESTRSIRPSAEINPLLRGGTELIAVASWYHNRIFPDSFHALKVSYSAVGLLAVYLFYRAAVMFRPGTDVRLLYFLGLFPSVLFWSSILGKDPVVLFAIGLYTYGVVGLTCRGRLWYALPICIGVGLAALIRLWLGPILLVPVLPVALRRAPGLFGKVAFLAAVGFALIWSFNTFREKFALRALEDIFSLTERMAEGMDYGGSAADSELQITGISSMLLYLPQGAFRALFRPLPGEVMNPFGLLAGVENLFLLSLVAIGLVRIRLSRLREPLVLWAITFLVCWSGIYGFVSTNLGAAVRFKLQVLPTILCLLLYLAWPDRPTAPARGGTPEGGP